MPMWPRAAVALFGRRAIPNHFDQSMGRVENLVRISSRLADRSSGRAGSGPRCTAGSAPLVPTYAGAVAKRKKRSSSLAPPPSPPVTAGLVSPMRTVPAGIIRPDYALSGIPSSRQSRAIRTDDEIAAMRIAGRVAADALIEVGRHVQPGITTDELDRIGHDAMVSAGSYPSTLNYRGYPKSLCTSVNEIVCHGIPDSRRLVDGDIVNVDVTAFIEGVHGDTSATFLVGDVDPTSVALVAHTRDAMHAGIAVVRPGARISDIGKAIEASVGPYGHSIVREFIGHGIGEQFHTSLQIPHYYDPRNDTVLLAGMTFTIEPMVNVGAAGVVMWDDDWTVSTADLQRTAQFEHTILVTDDGHELLTVTEDGTAAEVLFAVEPVQADARS